MTEDLNRLGNEVCRDAPKLFRGFAAESKSVSTEEAIDRAERYMEDRFASLSQDQVEKVCDVIDFQLELLK